MIRCVRGPAPPTFTTSAIQSEVAELRAYYALPSEDRRQRKYRFRLDLDEKFAPTLLERFAFKCAYCEQDLSHVKPAVDRFRPSADAMGFKEADFSRDHYWWLHMEWTNLLPVCPECVSLKANHFPVDGPRAPLEAGADLLEAERRLLVDPCADDTDRHFLFDDMGTIYGRSEMGRITVDLLRLNRDALREGRRRALRQTRDMWTKLVDAVHAGGDTYGLEQDLLDYFREGIRTAYLLIRRQFLIAQLRTNPDILSSLDFSDEFSRYIHASPNAPTQGDAVAIVEKPAPGAKGSVSLQTRIKQEGVQLLRHRIKRVEITNFRGIRHLDIKLPVLRGTRAPWYMLIGENGVGKSTFLQAIALTLMGEAARRDRAPNPLDLLGRHGGVANVRVHLTDQEEPLWLHVTENEVTGSADPAPILLMGYGAVRTTPWGIGALNTPRVRLVRCNHLFTHLSPMVNAERWLMGLSDARFDDAARVIKRLLVIDDSKTFERDRQGEVRLQPDGLTLDQLSNGYQAVITLAADIMMVLQAVYPDSEIGWGVVLLDEIDAHLHPRWKMRIVDRLRTVFPTLQFITSSHDPLCLRGIDAGEVAVMKRSPKGSLNVRTDLPAPMALRVDQLLTSPYFGLNSTVDPEVEVEFEQYYRLLALNERTAEQESALVAYRQNFRQTGKLGETRREQLMYEAIDRFLAREALLETQQEQKGLEADMWRLLADIWKTDGRNGG